MDLEMSGKEMDRLLGIGNLGSRCGCIDMNTCGRDDL